METIAIVPFYELSEDDKLLVLTWRNNDNIRKWMYDSEIIEQKNHLKFIENLKTVQEKQYFLVFQDKRRIGVIYFVDIDTENGYSEFGLYANPELGGVGSILMNTICEYGFNTLRLKRLVAEVFDNNLKAINLYSKFGFKFFDKKNVNEQEIICMELKYEDR